MFVLQALPIFLDKLVDPVTAVLLSVTVVLVFGEILPQAVCRSYGLQVKHMMGHTHTLCSTCGGTLYCLLCSLFLPCVCGT